MQGTMQYNRANIVIRFDDAASLDSQLGSTTLAKYSSYSSTCT
jgi:hypothetical protein